MLIFHKCKDKREAKEQLHFLVTPNYFADVAPGLV